MSGASLRRRLAAGGASAGRVVFGDRTGLAVFLAAVLWCGALWRIGIFITDSLTVANALANVADGRLAITQTPYSLTIGSQPGIVRVGDQVFGRNYGHVFLAVPLVWLLEGLNVLVDLRLLLAGAWSLCLVALAAQLRRLTGREWVGVGGSVAGVAVFLANATLATPLPERLLVLVGLQLSTILVAAVLATTLYRLLARFHGRRVGVTAGLAVLVATPVGFWAAIPKRHLITAAVAVVALFCFAVSRSGTDRRHLLARVCSYAAVGLLTTVHPFEAFFLFVVLVPVDLATAPSNDPRALALVGGAFVLSLLPFFALNTLISGNPLKSPRLLSGYAGSLDIPNPSDTGGSGTSGGGSGGSGTAGGSGSGGGADGTDGTGSDGNGTGVLGIVSVVVAWLSGIVGFVGSVAGFAVGWVEQSVAVLDDPGRLYRTFVRSGQLPGTSLSANDFEAIELTLLESFPLVAAFVWLPVSAVGRLRAVVEGRGVTTPARQTDVLAGGFAVVFTLVYLPRLPLHTQITLRYILPVFPLLLYGVVRLSVVRDTVAAVPRTLVGSYLAVVGVGGAALVGALAVLDPAIGEAMQLHALVGLASAALAVLALASWPAHGDRRLVAVGLAVPAGTTTVLLLLSRIEYFSYQVPDANVGTEVYALDVVRVIAELLPVFPA